jgi:hypothetical protein
MTSRETGTGQRKPSQLPQEVHDKILRKYHYQAQAPQEAPKQLPVFKISLFSKRDTNQQQP